MNSVKLIDYIENSFLRTLILNPNVTDISYNGESIFYLDNETGRQKSDIKISFDIAKDFVRQIANLSEKQFSFQSPQLDVSFGKYRINALHQSIAKRSNEDVINFSIRIGSTKLKITENSGFLPHVLVEFLDILIKSRCSIVLGGLTGSGKTEFQKFLLSRMEKNTRVIIIDNVCELDYVDINPNLDMNVWLANDEKKESNVQSLVRNALRSNPDWLIVAEARGEEMLDVLNSALTGHPILTTIHALDIESIPQRMTRLVMMGDKKSNHEDIYNDIVYHFRFFIYLKRDYQNGRVVRFIDEISYLSKNIWHPIYKNGQIFKLNNEIKSLLDLRGASREFENTFLKEVDA